VVIEAAPATATNRTTATFRFAAPGVRAPSFRCAVDRGAMTACSSPWTRTNLAEGSHTFRVQLAGPGRRLLASASHRWTVDLTPPVAVISGGPSGDTDDPTPTFAFSLDSPADLAECRITTSSEMPPLQRCASPYTAPALRGGAATFELRVRDAAGNDLTLTRAFTVVAPGSAPRTGDREPSPRS
jgi:large repetitive protein